MKRLRLGRLAGALAPRLSRHYCRSSDENLLRRTIHAYPRPHLWRDEENTGGNPGNPYYACLFGTTKKPG